MDPGGPQHLPQGEVCIHTNGKQTRQWPQQAMASASSTVCIRTASCKVHIHMNGAHVSSSMVCIHPNGLYGCLKNSQYPYSIKQGLYPYKWCMCCLKYNLYPYKWCKLCLKHSRIANSACLASSTVCTHTNSAHVASSTTCILSNNAHNASSMVCIHSNNASVCSVSLTGRKHQVTYLWSVSIQTMHTIPQVQSVSIQLHTTRSLP